MKQAIPIHPMVFSLKKQIEVLERRVSDLENKPILNLPTIDIEEWNKQGGIMLA